jgi:hypothetical protein
MAEMLVLLMDRNHKCTVEMDSGGMIYIPTFKIGTGFEGILRFASEISKAFK